MAGTPEQIFDIGAGGDGWSVPWVKEKKIWLKFRELFPTQFQQLTNLIGKKISSILDKAGKTINVHTPQVPE